MANTALLEKQSLLFEQANVVREHRNQMAEIARAAAREHTKHEQLKNDLLSDAVGHMSELVKFAVSVFKHRV